MKYGIIITFTMIYLGTQAQIKLRFEQFGIDQGLSQNVVYDLHQDKRGFLWIATHDGLNRYDGYEFKKYYHKPSDSNSLGNNSIYHIDEDADGFLWLTSQNYLHKFDPVSASFTRFPLPVENGKVFNNPKTDAVKSSQDHIPVFSEQFTGIFNYRQNLFSKLPENENYKWLNTVFDNNKKLIGFYALDLNGMGIHFYSLLSNRFERETGSILGNLNEKKIQFAQFHFNKNFWVIDHTNTLITGDETGKMISVQLPEKARSYGFTDKTIITADQSGNGYIARNNNLFYFDRKAETIKEILNSLNLGQSFNNAITDILVDNSDNVWIGTFGNGLYRLNLYVQQFSSLIALPENNSSIAGRFLKALGVGKEGNIYASFQDTGIMNEIDNKWQSVTRINWKYFFSNTDRYNYVYKHHPELRRKENTKQILSVTKELWNVTNPYLFIDKNHYSWERLTTAVRKFSPDSLFIETGTFILASCVDSENKIWLGTAGKGLIAVDALTGEQTVYTSLDKNSLADNTVNCMLYDTINHRLLLGTNYGLSILDITGKRFQNYSIESGLSHKTVYCMVFDDYGRLWLGTGNGLSMFDLTTTVFTNYNKSDGLINSEYNRDCAVKKLNGELVFGGTAGIDYFQPMLDIINIKPPKVEITDIYVFNKQIPAVKKLRLSHKENNLIITFSAMDFTNPGRNKYAYRLNGTEKEWNYLEGKGILSYANLSPGSYLFEVKSAVENKNREEVITTLQFTILAPWWQTWWFYSLLSLIVVSSLFIIFRYRLQKKLEIYKLRNRIHRDLHDDIGASLSTVNVYAEMLRQQPHKKEYLDLIAENTSEMLGNLEIITWVNNPKNDSFINLIDKMRQLAHPILYHKGINLEFKIAPGLESLMLPGVLRQNLFLAFKEAINNIIKHAGADTCIVIFRKKRNLLSMIIADNGKGLPTDLEVKGNGLSNMQNRIRDLKGEFIIRSENGTVIEINIPISTKSLHN